MKRLEHERRAGETRDAVECFSLLFECVLWPLSKCLTTELKLPSSILFKGQGTEHTTVKWSFPKDCDAGLTAVGIGSVVGDEFWPSKARLFLSAAGGCNRQMM